jgi:hypothetical protein
MNETALSLTNMRDLGYLEEAEAAILFDVKPVTLRNWRAQGTGPPFCKVHGNRVVYPLNGARDFLASRIVTPSTSPTLIGGKRHRSAPSGARVTRIP